MGELAGVGADFEDAPRVGLVVCLPPIEEAGGEEGSEERACADAGEEVAGVADLGWLFCVVSAGGVVEGGLEEVWEGYGALIFDLGKDF